jgi:ABC-type multidrug transport system permease subunit
MFLVVFGGSALFTALYVDLGAAPDRTAESTLKLSGIIEAHESVVSFKVQGRILELPAIVFSGFGTPISSMPEVFQWFTYADPLRYFLDVLRCVYLKGVGLEVLWPQFVALGALGIIMLSVSVSRFQKSLD